MLEIKAKATATSKVSFQDISISSIEKQKHINQLLTKLNDLMLYKNYLFVE